MLYILEAKEEKAVELIGQVATGLMGPLSPRVEPIILFQFREMCTCMCMEVCVVCSKGKEKNVTSD